MTPLLEQYIATRSQSEKLCAPLTVEDYVPQSVDFASPPKWHLAHTTWFFEEMILKNEGANYTVFDKAFSFLFNSYYNAVGERIARVQRGLITRPSVEEVYAYRKHVNKHMEKLLADGISKTAKELCILGLNHEQQHQELLISDIKYTFAQNPIYPIYDKQAFVNDHNEEQGWSTIEEGVYEVGYEGEAFCFDNEHGRHKIYIESFEISKALVTNKEFIEFIDAGGYENPKHWLDDGWTWINNNNIQQPLYWKKVNDEWFHYTLAGLQKVDLNAILCHVSYYEAAAFATYKGMRLATEFEWETAADTFKWGKRWEYTNSAYLPYPRFKIKEGAVGEYNGKFMSNQMVLRGASVATAKGHSRKTYRNFFHPHLQWQFSGIRLVK